LLVLDNCEHLIEACAGQVERMLRAAAGLKIVASSREALGISGEIIYRVPSLSLPEVDSVSAETLAASEAVQLFLERARAASPGFRLAAKNAPAVATICRRLDGIPLALELAAARLAVFSAEQIAARLDDRFKLLTGGSRTALPRQQTLRALIDWSYDMLTEEERALLRRLSVFAGGWTFEAAEVTLPDLKVLDLLPQLANKSLVAVEDSGEEPRYRLLETVRQYARDRLLDMGEGERTRRRHAAYFTQFVETHARRLRGDAAMTSVHLLEAEHDNLRAALAWSLDQDLDAMLRLITAMSEFWFRRGFEAEGRAWIQDALKRHEESAPLEGEAAHRRRQGVAGALQVLAWLTFSQGDYRGAFEASRRCEALARELGDLRLLSTLLSFMASALLMAGDVTAAETLAAEGLEAARKSEDPVAVGVATGMLGWRLSMHGRYDEADAHLEEGLALLRKSGDQFSVLMLLFGFGMNARWQGRLEEARAKLGELLPMFEGLGDHHRANMVRSEIGHIDRAEGNLARAAAVYRQTIVEWQRLGHRAAVAHQLESFAGLSLADRHHERAARLFGAAESLREQIGIPMTAVETVSYQEEVAALRAALGEAQIASFWQEGRRLTMEQAIGFALEQA
jgi:non-specific serine/threonine protein kinase